jgi:hypothetical protein
VRLIANECHNHAVQVEEEHDQVETKLDERFLHAVSLSSIPYPTLKNLPYLLMHIQLSENLSRIQQVLVLEYLLRIVSKQRQIQDKRDPVSIDQEQES